MTVRNDLPPLCPGCLTSRRMTRISRTTWRCRWCRLEIDPEMVAEYDDGDADWFVGFPDGNDQ